MRIASAIAAASVAITGALSNAPVAQAAAANCWHIPVGARSVEPFRCDVSARTNANGHLVYDIRHFQGNGAHFSVIIWDDGMAEVFIDGERYDTTWYYDRHADVRLDIGDEGEFVF